MKKLCLVLEVSRSGYYAWVRQGCPEIHKKDAVLLAKIRQIERENHGNYGGLRIQHALKSEMSAPCGLGKVRRIMRENGIKAQIKCKYKPQTTKADPKEKAFSNLLNQDFSVSQANKVWLADITYIRINGKWAYLAAVLDLSRKNIVGWEIGANPNAELACVALRKAATHQIPPKGLIHHSDRGSQYTSRDYRKLLEKFHMQGSMSRKGVPYDNAPMESFFRTLKVEWINRQCYYSLEQAKQSLFYFIDVYYNRKRHHSSIGYETPIFCENQRKLAV